MLDLLLALVLATPSPAPTLTPIPVARRVRHRLTHPIATPTPNTMHAVTPPPPIPGPS